MSKFLEVTLGALFLLMSMIASVILCYWVGEQFYFDRVFYKKSAAHGYFNRWYYDASLRDLTQVEKWLIAGRETDLRALLGGKIWDPAPEGTFTIAIIGDSFTYGIGVQGWETWPRKLTGALKQHGITARVYSFAEPGNSLLDYYALYKMVKKQLNPDIIIFGLVSNDLLFNGNRYPGTAEIQAELNQQCPQPEFINMAINYGDAQNYFDNSLASFSPEWKNHCYLEEITRLLGRDSSVHYFSYANGATNLWCSKDFSLPQSELMTDYIGTFETAGISGYRDQKTLVWPKRVSPIEGHPSKQEHQRYAIEIAQYLAEMRIND